MSHVDFPSCHMSMSLGDSHVFSATQEISMSHVTTFFSVKLMSYLTTTCHCGT